MDEVVLDVLDDELVVEEELVLVLDDVVLELLLVELELDVDEVVV